MSKKSSVTSLMSSVFLLKFIQNAIAVLAVVAATGSAAVTVFSNDNPASGSLDMIIDRVFTEINENNCLTMSGSTPSVTIDYGTVMNIKTIFVLSENTPSNFNSLQGLHIYAHNDPYIHDTLCPFNPTTTGFFDCQAEARYLTFAHFAESATFSICKVVVYDEVIINRQILTVGTNDAEKENQSVLLEKQPIYSSPVELFSDSTLSALFQWKLDQEYWISRLALLTPQDSDIDQHTDFSISVYTSDSVLSGTCTANIQTGKLYYDIQCKDGPIYGQLIRIKKVAQSLSDPQNLSLAGLAIFQNSCDSCTQNHVIEASPLNFQKYMWMQTNIRMPLQTCPWLADQCSDSVLSMFCNNLECSFISNISGITFPNTSGDTLFPTVNIEPVSESRSYEIGLDTFFGDNIYNMSLEIETVTCSPSLELGSTIDLTYILGSDLNQFTIDFLQKPNCGYKAYAFSFNPTVPFMSFSEGTAQSVSLSADKANKSQFNVLGLNTFTIKVQLKKDGSRSSSMTLQSDIQLVVKALDCNPALYYFDGGSAQVFSTSIEVSEGPIEFKPSYSAPKECGNYQIVVDENNPLKEFFDIENTLIEVNPTDNKQVGEFSIFFYQKLENHPELDYSSVIQEFQLEITPCPAFYLEYAYIGFSNTLMADSALPDYFFMLGLNDNTLTLSLDFLQYRVIPAHCTAPIDFSVSGELPIISLDQQTLTIQAFATDTSSFLADDQLVEAGTYNFVASAVINSLTTLQLDLEFSVNVIDLTFLEMPVIELSLFDEVELDLESLFLITQDDESDPFIEITVSENDIVDYDEGAGKYGKIYLFSNKVADLGSHNFEVSVTVGSRKLPSNRFTKTSNLSVAFLEEAQIEPAEQPDIDEEEFIEEVDDINKSDDGSTTDPAAEIEVNDNSFLIGELWAKAYPPYFTEDIPSYFAFRIDQEEWYYTLPQVSSIGFPSNIETFISSGATNLIEFQSGENLFTLLRKPNQADTGLYRVTVTLSDSYGNSKIYAILIEVLDLQGNSAIFNDVELLPAVNQQDNELVKPLVLEVANQTTILSQEDALEREIQLFLDKNTYEVISTESALEKLKSEGKSLSKWDSLRLEKPLYASIASISQQGQMEVWFSNFMTLLDEKSAQEKRQLERLQDNILMFVINEDAESQDEEYEIKVKVEDWVIDQFDPRIVKFQLGFDRPEIVSTIQKHKILVIMPPSSSFIDIYGRSFEEVQRLKRPIPPQIVKDSTEEKIAEVAAELSTGAQVAVGIVLGINFFITAGLNQLLGMIETMQIILMPPIFNIMIPALPCSILTLMMEICHFDIIEVGEYYDMLFQEMPPTDPLSESLDNIGFGDTYFIHNLGALSLIIVLFTIFQTLTICLSQKKCFGKRSKKIKCFNRVNTYARSQLPNMFWNAPLQLMIESFIILVMCCFIQFKEPIYDFLGQKVNMALTYFFMVVTGAIAVYTSIWLFCNFKQLGDRNLIQKYGSLYKDLNVGNKWIIAYRFVFFLRRTQLSYSVVFQLDNIVGQLFTSFAIELLYLCVMYNGKIFIIKQTSRIAFRDEILYMFVLYHVLLLSGGFVAENIQRLRIGYSLCTLFGLHLFLDLFRIFREAMIAVYRKISRWFALYSAMKAMRKVKKDSEVKRRDRVNKMKERRSFHTLMLKMKNYEDNDSSSRSQNSSSEEWEKVEDFPSESENKKGNDCSILDASIKMINTCASSENIIVCNEVPEKLETANHIYNNQVSHFAPISANKLIQQKKANDARVGKNRITIIVTDPIGSDRLEISSEDDDDSSSCSGSSESSLDSESGSSQSDQSDYTDSSSEEEDKDNQANESMSSNEKEKQSQAALPKIPVPIMKGKKKISIKVTPRLRVQQQTDSSAAGVTVDHELSENNRHVDNIKNNSTPVPLLSIPDNHYGQPKQGASPSSLKLGLPRPSGRGPLVSSDRLQTKQSNKYNNLVLAKKLTVDSSRSKTEAGRDSLVPSLLQPSLKKRITMQQQIHSSMELMRQESNRLFESIEKDVIEVMSNNQHCPQSSHNDSNAEVAQSDRRIFNPKPNVNLEMKKGRKTQVHVQDKNPINIENLDSDIYSSKNQQSQNESIEVDVALERAISEIEMDVRSNREQLEALSHQSISPYQNIDFNESSHQSRPNKDYLLSSPNEPYDHKLGSSDLKLGSSIDCGQSQQPRRRDTSQEHHSGDSNGLLCKQSLTLLKSKMTYGRSLSDRGGRLTMTKAATQPHNHSQARYLKKKFTL